jgi:hypothetical protein
VAVGDGVGVGDAVGLAVGDGVGVSSPGRTVTEAGFNTGAVAEALRSTAPPKRSPTIGVTRLNGCVTETVTWLPVVEVEVAATLQAMVDAGAPAT